MSDLGTIFWTAGGLVALVLAWWWAGHIVRVRRAEAATAAFLHAWLLADRVVRERSAGAAARLVLALVLANGGGRKRHRAEAAAAPSGERVADA